MRKNGERGVEGEDLSPTVNGDEISSIEDDEKPPGALDKPEGLKLLKFVFVLVLVGV